MTENTRSRKKGKGMICLAGTATALLLLAGSISFAENLASRIPEKLDINIQEALPDGGFGKDKKAVKGFSHKLHAEKYLVGQSDSAANPFTDDFTCAACHAGAEKVEDVTGQDKSKRLVAAIEAGGGVKNYKKFMHATCMDCHKKMKKAKETTGPTSCKGCHGKSTKKKRAPVEGC